MKVILLENVSNLGRTGDVVKVSDGYARNFLLPRNLVAVADEENMKLMKHHERALSRKREREKVSAQDVLKKLEAFSCTVTRKVGEHEKLFGSVTTGDIATTLKQSGFDVDKRQIELPEAIKKLGVYTVSVKLHPEAVAQVKVWVVAEAS